MRRRVMLAVVLVTFLSFGIFSGFPMANTFQFTFSYVRQQAECRSNEFCN